MEKVVHPQERGSRGLCTPEESGLNGGWFGGLGGDAVCPGGCAGLGLSRVPQRKSFVRHEIVLSASWSIRGTTTA